MLHADGSLFAVADRIEKCSVDPETGEVILCRIGTFLAKGEVVLHSTPLVAVALNSRLLAGVGFEPVDILFQDISVSRSDRVSVKSK